MFEPGVLIGNASLPLKQTNKPGVLNEEKTVGVGESMVIDSCGNGTEGNTIFVVEVIGNATIFVEVIANASVCNGISGVSSGIDVVVVVPYVAVVVIVVKCVAVVVSADSADD